MTLMYAILFLVFFWDAVFSYFNTTAQTKFIKFAQEVLITLKLCFGVLLQLSLKLIIFD